MRRSFFGSHLYNQIVIPLLAASILVATVAWGASVYFLNNLTSDWASQSAREATQDMVSRTEQYGGAMDHLAAVAAQDRDLHLNLESRDARGLQIVVDGIRASSGVDNVLVLDSAGRVVSSSGLVPAGMKGRTPWAAEASGSPLASVVRVMPLAGMRTVTAIEPVTTRAGVYRIALSRQIDNGFLQGLAGGEGTAFCLYSTDRQLLACSIGPEVKSTESGPLRTALLAPVPQILQALDGANSVSALEMHPMTLNGQHYQVWARPVMFGSGGTPQGYLVGTINEQASVDAGRITGNFIALWSFAAVVALVGLGGWVARRVSDPLEELAQSARRVAEGDFSTKVQIEGTNEVTELADSFNVMTDSLHERSESLTKKVLELATLYEMSRSLGSTFELKELLDSVLDSALRIFDLDLGYVTLLDKETGHLVVRATRGANAEIAEGAVRSSMSEWVVREGRPLIFNPEKAGTELDALTGARAALCVPLISSDGAIGSITVGSSDAEYRFNSDDVRLLSTIANHVTIAIGNIELFSSLQEAYLATVRSLAAAVDAKDSYTRGHSDHVATYATLIAERMGLSGEQRTALEMAAYLHDIGKIGIREDVLRKEDRLTDPEMAHMRQHPLIGASILKPVVFPWAIIPVVRHHHEYWDGRGYPAGLKGEEIPLLARILTVADAFQAMTSDRPYRARLTEPEAIEELRQCSGGQFDPRIVDTFVAILEEFDRSGEPLVVEAPDDVTPEEARAIFSALVDGLLTSFRGLGGPRLASNAEKHMDVWLTEQDAPYRLVRGKVQFQSDTGAVTDGEIDQMRAALRHLDQIMGDVSGATLVDRFYDDALNGLSSRMRRLVDELGFSPG